MSKKIEGANLLLRSELAAAITEQAGRFAETQTEQAELLGISQPWLSRLARGKVDSISVDRLVEWANWVGLEVELTIRRAAKDELYQLPQKLL